MKYARMFVLLCSVAFVGCASLKDGAEDGTVGPVGVVDGGTPAGLPTGVPADAKSPSDATKQALKDYRQDVSDCHTLYAGNSRDRKACVKDAKALYEEAKKVAAGPCTHEYTEERSTLAPLGALAAFAFGYDRPAAALAVASFIPWTSQTKECEW